MNYVSEQRGMQIFQEVYHQWSWPNPNNVFTSCHPTRGQYGEWLTNERPPGGHLPKFSSVVLAQFSDPVSICTLMCISPCSLRCSLQSDGCTSAAASTECSSCSIADIQFRWRLSGDLASFSEKTFQRTIILAPFIILEVERISQIRLGLNELQCLSLLSVCLSLN